MRILVCGGRDYKNYLRVDEELNNIKKENDIVEIIVGGAKGADTFAEQWAFGFDQPCHRYPANWKVHGKPAGMLRNRAMLSLNPDLVIAFPGGKGTANMVQLARDAGIPVKEVP